jgi:transcriptional regulator with XRE-family HTH domain
VKFDDALTRGLAGGRGKKQTPRGSVRDAEKALGSKRAVANRLGVSVRTVQRWASGKGKPRADNAGKLNDLGRSSDVRGALSPGKRRKLTNKGGKAKIKGYQGPLRGPAGDRQDYRRDREIIFDLDPDTLVAMYSAWQSGDEEGAREVLADHLADSGYPSWSFGDIDEFRIW